MMKAKHEGLISFETYTRIQERIKEGARIAARADINEDFPLRGFILCGDCDRPLTSCWSKSKTGKKHPYYMCFNKGCCSYRKSIRRDEIESEFTDLLGDVLPSAAKLSAAKAMFADIWDARIVRAKEHAALYTAKIQDLDKQVEALLTRLIDAETKTVIQAYEKKIRSLEQEKLVLAEKAAGSGLPARPFGQMFELVSAFLSSPCKVWESWRFELQRLVLRLTFSDRLAYVRNEGFRTPELSLPFNTLGEVLGAIVIWRWCQTNSNSSQLGQGR